MNLKKMALLHKKKLQSIKAFVCDVDGILTDGRVFYAGKELGWNRFFNAWDGYGLKILMQAGLKVGVISGGDSVGLRERVSNLSLSFSYLGDEDKRKAFLDIEKTYSLKPHEILYMGDEYFDIPLLKRAGFSATVPQASLEIQKSVHLVTTRPAGHGAVREVVDLLCLVQKITPPINDFLD